MGEVDRDQRTDRVSEGPTIGDFITMRPQGSQGQGHGSNIKGNRSKILCLFTSTPHGKFTDKSGHMTSIPWTQQLPHESQGQSHITKVKGHRIEIPCSLTSTCPWVVHRQTGYIGTNILDTAAASTRFPISRSYSLRSHVIGLEFHAHAHLPLMGGPHCQFGQGNLNISWPQPCPQKDGQTD